MFHRISREDALELTNKIVEKNKEIREEKAKAKEDTKKQTNNSSSTISSMKPTLEETTVLNMTPFTVKERFTTNVKPTTTNSFTGYSYQM